MRGSKHLNPSTQEAQATKSLSLRPARATQTDPVFKKTILDKSVKDQPMGLGHGTHVPK